MTTAPQNLLSLLLIRRNLRRGPVREPPPVAIRGEETTPA